MALPYACGCAIAGTAIRATSRPISPSGLNTVSGFFDQFARLRRWRRHCGRRERTSVRPLALGLASLYLHQTDKKSLSSPYLTRWAQYGLLSPYFAFAQYGLLSRLFRIRSIRRLGSGYVLGLAPLRAYAYAVALLPAGNTRNFCRPISPVGLNTGSCRAYFAFAQYGAYSTPATMPQSDD